MDSKELIELRLVNQQLTSTGSKTPVDVVSRFAAMQAQDYAMAKWAIGMRLPNATDAGIEAALDAGQLIRLHIMRPTWHIVAAQDVRWMLDLTADRLNRTVGTMYRKLELDEAVFRQSNDLITKLLANGEEYTRAEIMAHLGKHGIVASDVRAAHLMFRAELDKIVCNGKRRGKQFTYTLFDAKVPAQSSISDEEALARLTLKYFTSHGPATERDFAWWSGLSLTDVRRGIQSVGDQLNSVSLLGKTYFFVEHSLPKEWNVTHCIHLLPAFDEYLVGYTDRSAALEEYLQRVTIPIDGISKPTVIKAGKVVATWQRTIRKESIHIQVSDVSELLTQTELQAAVQHYSDFYGIEVSVDI